MPPARDPGSLFAATLKLTDPSPWPAAVVVRATQDASLRADQLHSRFVVTRAVPVPPSGENVTLSPWTWTAHLVCDGAVVV
jgi:hypothetical protein